MFLTLIAQFVTNKADNSYSILADTLLYVHHVGNSLLIVQCAEPESKGNTLFNIILILTHEQKIGNN